MYKEIISKKLEQLIKERFHTQKNMSHKLGLHEGQLGKWINKKIMPNLDLLEKIALKCNLPPEYFFLDDSNTDSISINYELFDEIVELANQYAKQNNIIISPKKYLILYETISNLKTTNPKTSTKELFDILKLTLITN